MKESDKSLSIGNIRIIFNIVKENGMDPFPVNKTNNRNQ